MIEKIKLALRIKSKAFDLELLELIESAKIDLKISGVVKANEEDHSKQTAEHSFRGQRNRERCVRYKSCHA